jgi:hypothetical protein
MATRRGGPSPGHRGTDRLNPPRGPPQRTDLFRHVSVVPTVSDAGNPLGVAVRGRREVSPVERDLLGRDDRGCWARVFRPWRPAPACVFEQRDELWRRKSKACNVLGRFVSRPIRHPPAGETNRLAGHGALRRARRGTGHGRGRPVVPESVPGARPCRLFYKSSTGRAGTCPSPPDDRPPALSPTPAPTPVCGSRAGRAGSARAHEQSRGWGRQTGLLECRVG